MSKQFLLVLTEASEEITKVCFCVQPQIKYMLNVSTDFTVHFLKTYKCVI